MLQPIGNTTVLPPAEWHPEPRVRGTFGILSNCLITLSLCIWTSLHLNVPEHGKGYLQKYRKLGWMLLGLVAPEIVLWAAWEQRRQVKRLSNLMRQKGFMPREPRIWRRASDWISGVWQKAMVFLKLRVEISPELTGVRYGPGDTHVNAWTDVHSWYVVMGGMAFEDQADEDERFMPGNHRCMVLDLKLFTWILENQHELIPDLSREYVEDKSKSDLFAKAITYWQTSFFCIQCIFRLSQNLSVTFLELSVLAHAICALLLFLVWWTKPRDVLEPTLLRHEDALDLCACSFYCNDPEVFEYSSPQAPDSCLEIDSPQDVTASGSGFGHSGSTAQFYPFIKVENTFWSPCKRKRDVSETLISIKIDTRYIKRLTRVHRSVRRHPELLKSLPRKSKGMIERVRNTPRQISKFATPNHGEAIDDSASFYSLIGGLTLAGVIYGGLHYIASGAQFPTKTQSELWHAASLTVWLTGPFYITWTGFVGGGLSYLSPLINYWSEGRDYTVSNILAMAVCGIVLLLGASALALIVFLPLLWYISCRAFLVVECFVMLAHIPESALAVPIWLAYIPHIK